MYTLTKITFKNLDSREANNFILWFEDLADRLEITVYYENHIIDELVCDFSFDISNFKMNVNEEYLEFTLKGHNEEYGSIYASDFTEVVLN